MSGCCLVEAWAQKTRPPYGAFYNSRGLSKVKPINVSTLEMIFCAFCRKLFREGTYLVVYPG